MRSPSVNSCPQPQRAGQCSTTSSTAHAGNNGRPLPSWPGCAPCLRPDGSFPRRGDAADLPTDVLQAYLDAVAAGRLTVPIHRTYALDEIPEAHADMEHGRATGKLVVLP